MIRVRVSGHRHEAQTLIWLILTLPALLGVAGLAIDGGLLLTARRQLQSVADGAARAGATRVDTAHLRDSGGAEIQLDRDLAIEAARTYIDESPVARSPGWPLPPDVRVEVGSQRVHVLIRASARTAFLRIVQIDDVPVAASAFADVQYGIHDAGGG